MTPGPEGTAPPRRPWHRKRRYLGLLLVLSLYGPAFAYGGLDDTGKRETRADAVATDITCEPDWFLLGAVHDCRATIRYEGRELTRWFRHELGPDDVGREVPVTMTGVNPRTSEPRFVPARADQGVPEAVFSLVVLAAFAVIIFLAARILGVTTALHRRRTVPVPAPGERAARAVRLRSRARIALVLVPFCLYGAYFVHGTLVAGKAEAGRRPPEAVATGTAVACEPDWRFLGAVESCEVDVVVTDPLDRFLSPTGEQEFTLTLGHSQFTSEDVGGAAKPLAATTDANPLTKGRVWTVTPAPAEAEWAKVLMILLPAAALGLFITSRVLAGRARGLEKAERERVPVPQP